MFLRLVKTASAPAIGGTGARSGVTAAWNGKPLKTTMEWNPVSRGVPRWRFRRGGDLAVSVENPDAKTSNVSESLSNRIRLIKPGRQRVIGRWIV